MSGAGGVRAGGAFVEIFAKDGAFQAAMRRVETKLRTVGTAMRRVGTSLAVGGGAVAAPMAMALRQFAAFDDVLRATQASTGQSAAEMDRLRTAALAMSKELGMAPTEVAAGFMELLKAGMSLEQVLAGAGRAAIQFAQVGGMAVGEAAVVMADAMNVFGVSSETAANTLSSAADASSTDIAGIALAFSQVSAVAGLANQSIGDTAAALAILANNGIKGSDAGTSLKTMLMRLMAPADDAAEAMSQIGLSTQSFRNADGTMKPMVEIIRTLNDAMAGMDQSAKDDIFRRIFGQDAIRAAAVLTTAGVDGFNAMQGSMDGALSVSEKFQTMMAGLSGAIKSLLASLQRLAIAFGDAVAPAVAYAAQLISGFVSVIERFTAANPRLAQALAGTVAAIVALGGVMIVGGFAMQTMAAGLGGLRAALTILPALFTPVGIAVMGLVGAVTAATLVARELSPAFKRETDAIWQAVTKLDFSTAWKIMNLNFAIALTEMAGKASNILGTMQGFFASTGSFMGDKLMEGMDRFMGLFGKDIITLQNAWERLGIYFRAAFDWRWAVTGMQAALDAADQRAEEARKKAPTADARADQRAEGRKKAARDRQREMDANAGGWEDTANELRRELDQAHADLNRKPEEAAAPASESDAGKKAGGAPGGPPGAPVTAAEAVRPTGSVGTFGSAEGLGISAELNPLVDSSKQTATNTGIAAEALQRMAGMNPSEMPAVGSVGAQGGSAGIAGGVLAGAGPAEVAGAAKEGTTLAATFTTMNERLMQIHNVITQAFERHDKLAIAANGLLARIADNTASGEAKFS